MSSVLPVTFAKMVFFLDISKEFQKKSNEKFMRL